MYSSFLVMALVSIGLVLMESNLEELCSKPYLDSFVDTYSTRVTELQITRKVNSNDKSYHSWNLNITEQSDSFKTKGMDYILKDGQTPKSSLSMPKICAIDLAPIYPEWDQAMRKRYQWTLNDIQFINDNINGPKLKYLQSWFKITDSTIPSIHPIGETTSSLNSFGILLSGLLCKKSDKTIYVFTEKFNSLNDSNRTQFVSRLRFMKSHEVDKSSISQGLVIYKPILEFWLESMNQTVIDFLGIVCPNITTTPTIDTESDDWMSTPTLYIIGCTLIVSGIILALIDTILLIRRIRNPKISTNTDMPSDVTSSPGESTTTVSKNASESLKFESLKLQSLIDESVNNKSIKKEKSGQRSQPTKH